MSPCQDDYTWHCWTSEDIRSGRKVEGHGFFEYHRQKPDDLGHSPQDIAFMIEESHSSDETEDRRLPLKALAILVATSACLVAALFALHPSHDPTTVQICMVVAVHAFLTFGLITQNTVEGLVFAVMTAITGCVIVSTFYSGASDAKRWMVVVTVGASLVASRAVRRYMDGLPRIE